ncbi:MAG: type II toxin-antitoxin system VapB family antitoxin [Polyangiaceae bacterium]
MKTTVEISDALLEEARRLLASEKTTLRALIEEGLRLVIEEHTERKPFKLRPAAFKGRGLRPEVKDADWSAIRDMAYEGRGG